MEPTEDRYLQSTQYLYDNGPYPGGCAALNLDGHLSLMDDFTVPDGMEWTVSGFRWFHYWDSTTGGLGTSLDIQFREDGHGIPNIVMKGGLVPIASYQETATGNFVLDRYAIMESVARFTTPVTFTSGTYWFDAATVTPGHDHNFWICQPKRYGGEAFNNMTLEGMYVPLQHLVDYEADLNFRLEGTEKSIAQCQDVVANADTSCQDTKTAAAAFYSGSRNDLSLSVLPEGPYNVGITDVTLTVNDGQVTRTCTASITVRDNEPLEQSKLSCGGGPGIITPCNLPVEYTTSYSAKKNGCPVSTTIAGHKCQFCDAKGRTINGACQVGASDSSFSVTNVDQAGQIISYTVVATDVNNAVVQQECSVCVENPDGCVRNRNRNLRWKKGELDAQFQCGDWDIGTSMYQCADI